MVPIKIEIKVFREKNYGALVCYQSLKYELVHSVL